MIRIARLLRIAFFVCIALWMGLPRASAETQVRINELCASNKTMWLDDFGVYSDYLELYNAGDAEAVLSGYALSDGSKTHVFGADCMIPAKGYCMLALSGRVVSGNTLHIPFKLSSGAAETISLLDPSGAVIDSVVLPPLDADTSFSRQGESGFAVTAATPGAENAAGELYDGAALSNQALVLPPTFSHPSGFYDEPFSLSIAAPEGYRVYYTLDCADPAAASAEYTAPILITDVSAQPNQYANITEITTKEYTPPANAVDKAMVVRAVAADGAGHVSQPVTCVYFVGYQNKALYGDMAIASLVTAPENLFDPDTGMYVTGRAYEEWLADPASDPATDITHIPANFYQRGRAWEKSGTFTFFDANHKLCLSQNVGIRVHGNYSRNRIQKSLNLYARKEYGTGGTFAYDFFDGLSLDTLMLRASRSADEYLRDPLVQSFCAGRAVGIQAYVPCLLFLDGEYWGVYYVRPKQNARYLAELYDVPEEDVVLIKNSELDEGSVFGYNAYKDMLSFIINNDFNDPALYAKLGEMIDIQSYLDYVCAEIFAGNVDWPNNNEMLWRTMPAGGAGYRDGRWRWLLFDLDQTMGYASHTPDLDSLQNALRNNTFKSLWNSALFREDFYRNFAEMANSCFYPETASALLDQLDAWLSPHFNAQKARFNSGYSAKQRLETKTYFSDFLTKRFAAIAPLLAPDRPLRALTLEQSAPGGAWQVEEFVPALGENGWSGAYFAGEEAHVSVAPLEGFLFDGWELDGAAYGDSLSVALSMEADHTLRALFTPLTRDCPAAAAPVGSVLLSGDAAEGLVIQAGEGWQAGDGIAFSLSTAGLERAQVTIRAEAGKKAPRDWTLAYCLAGGDFVPLTEAEWSLIEGESLLRFTLPDACMDDHQVLLRLTVASGFCVNGKEKLYGATGGAVTLRVKASASPADRTFAAYKEALRAAQASVARYPQLAKTLEDYAVAEDATQQMIDSATRAITNARYLVMLDEHTQTLNDFSAAHDVSALLSVSQCGDAPIYTITDEMTAYGDRMPITAPYDKDAYLYAFADGHFTLHGMLRRSSKGISYLPAEPGQYLALPMEIARYAVESAVFSPVEWTEARRDQWFSGFTPDETRLLALKTVSSFSGQCELPFEDWLGGAVVYCYRINGAELSFVCRGKQAFGTLSLTGMADGEYLLSAQSMEECAALSRRRAERLAQQAAPKPASKKDAMRYLLPGAGIAALLLIGYLIFRKRKS